MIKDAILRFVVEDDEDEPAKDILGLNVPGMPEWNGQPGGDVLYDQHGNRVAYSHNLRGLRRWVLQYIAQSVEIRKKANGEGAMLVRFLRGHYCVSHWADYGVMTNALRNWTNLKGVDLIVNGEPAGKIGYRNPALMEAVDDYEEGDLKEILNQRAGAEAELSGDRIWKKVGDSQWHFQVNEHQKVILINWGERWGDQPWEIRTMFDEMTLTVVHGTEQEVMDILEREGYLPGGGMHTREMKFHGFQEGLEDDDDMKDVTVPDESTLVQVSDEEWGRYGHEAIWSYNVEGKWWKVGTTARYPEISVGTPHHIAKGWQQDDPDPAIFAVILKAVARAAKGKGFDRVNFVKSTPRVYDAMEEAVAHLEDTGLITITGHSGAVIVASLRGRLPEAMEDDDLFGPNFLLHRHGDESVYGDEDIADMRLLHPGTQLWLLYVDTGTLNQQGDMTRNFSGYILEYPNGTCNAISPRRAQQLFSRKEDAIGWLIGQPLTEAMEDDEVYPGMEELSLDQIKQIEPGFFNRDANRRFGTVKVYKYPGNYVVVKNTKEYRPAAAFAPARSSVSFAVYQLTRSEDRPNGILLYKGTADDLQDAKEMIKTGDFRPYMERVRERWNLGEAMEDDPIHQIPKIESIQVVGRNWWRRGYGGNYYRADIYVNDQKVTTLPEQGGSEQQYLYDAFDWLERNGYITREHYKSGAVEWPKQVAERMGFKLTYEAYSVRRERDL